MALVLLAQGSTTAKLLVSMGLLGDYGLVMAASLGAALVMGIVLFVARRGMNTLTLLILGLMFGYLTSALVSLLVFAERIQVFSLWSAGSFQGGVTWQQMRAFAPVVLLGLAMAQLLPKITQHAAARRHLCAQPRSQRAIDATIDHP